VKPVKGEGAGATDGISGMSRSLTNSDFYPAKNVRCREKRASGRLAGMTAAPYRKLSLKIRSEVKRTRRPGQL